MDQAEEDAGKRAVVRRRRQARTLGLLVVAAAVVAFVVQNSQAVQVKFWFVTARPQLIWVIGGCVVIGAALGFVAGRSRRQRGKRRPSAER